MCSCKRATCNVHKTFNGERVADIFNVCQFHEIYNFLYVRTWTIGVKTLFRVRGESFKYLCYSLSDAGYIKMG